MQKIREVKPRRKHKFRQDKQKRSQIKRKGSSGNSVKVQLHRKPHMYSRFLFGFAKQKILPRLPTVSAFQWFKYAVGLLTIVFTISSVFGGIFSYGMNFSNQPLTQTLISGNHLLADADILEIGQVQSGIPLDEIDPYLVSSLIQSHPMIKTAIAKKFYPHTLIIHLEEYQPFAYLQFDDSYYLIDRDQRPLQQFAYLPESNRAILSGMPPNEIQLETPINSRNLDLGLELLSFAQSELDWEQIARIDISDPLNIKLQLTGNQTFVHFGATNFQERVLDFKEYYPQLVQQHSHIKTIDLRYPQQILITE